MTILLDALFAPGGIRAAYQPIVHLADGPTSVHAYEGLARGPRGTNIESPAILFEYARQKGEEPAVDRACVAVMLRHAAQLLNGARLHLNVHASTLDRDVRFPEMLVATATAAGVEAPRLTVEIVEHNAASDSVRFLHALERLRESGIRIALDDVGLGHSNFRMILDSRPDYLKIDRYFVSGCANDARRQTVIESITSLAHGFGSRIVAEGVENAADLQCLRRRGIVLFQGFHFSRPFLVDPMRPWLERAGSQFPNPAR